MRHFRSLITMRRRALVALACAALLSPLAVGATAEAAVAGDVTMSVDVQRITAGNAPQLSGTVADALGNPAAATEVAILGKSYGQSTWTAVTRATTDNDGRYTAEVRPVRQTSYVADVAGVQSAPLTVYVSARITITSPTASSAVQATTPFFGALAPAAPQAAMGLATYDNGRWVVLGSAGTDAASRFLLHRPLPAGTHTFVVFTSARNGVLAGYRSLRVAVEGVAAAATAVSSANQIMARVNAERTSRGLQAVSGSPCLYAMATDWSEQMAARRTMVHRSQTDFASRSAACARTHGSYAGAGENIAVGYPDGNSVMAGWMASPGHRANILNASFTHLGIGVVLGSDRRWYYTQNFVAVQ